MMRVNSARPRPLKLAKQHVQMSTKLQIFAKGANSHRVHHRPRKQPQLDGTTTRKSTSNRNGHRTQRHVPGKRHTDEEIRDTQSSILTAIPVRNWHSEKQITLHTT